jgi:hypothetical protein
MAGELTAEISEKLHPTLALFLEALRALRVQIERSGNRAASAGFLANSLHAIRECSRREEFTSLPVSKNCPEKTSNSILKQAIVSFSPCVMDADKANIEALRGISEVLENGAAKALLKFSEMIYRKTSPQGRILTKPIFRAIRSLRSNRDPQAASEKISHWLIFTFLFSFGAMKRTDSEYSLSVLTSGELKAVFDYACPACLQEHSIEALRKSASRFVNGILRCWPVENVKGNRTGAGMIKIRFAGLPVRPLGWGKN